MAFAKDEFRFSEAEAKRLTDLVERHLFSGKASSLPKEARGIKLTRDLIISGQSDQAVRKLIETVFRSIENLLVDMPAKMTKETLAQLVETHKNIRSIKSSA